MSSDTRGLICTLVVLSGACGFGVFIGFYIGKTVTMLLEAIIAAGIATYQDFK